MHSLPFKISVWLFCGLSLGNICAQKEYAVIGTDEKRPGIYENNVLKHNSWLVPGINFSAARFNSHLHPDYNNSPPASLNLSYMYCPVPEYKLFITGQYGFYYQRFKYPNLGKIHQFTHRYGIYIDNIYSLYNPKKKKHFYWDFGISFGIAFSNQLQNSKQAILRNYLRRDFTYNVFQVANLVGIEYHQKNNLLQALVGFRVMPSVLRLPIAEKVIAPFNLSLRYVYPI